MKKLFMFLVTAGLATFGTSCTSDDSSANTGTGNETREKQLVLSADKDKAVVGETVTFKTTVEGKVQSDFDIYVDGTKVANPFKTTKRGNLKVVAKKAGYMNSAEFDLKVRDQGDPENTKLVLTANPDKVKEGEMVTFSVMNGGKVITDAEVTLNGVKVSNPWKATVAGSYKFIAKKAKYDDSNEVTVVVEKDAPTFTNFISLNNVQSELGFAVMAVDMYEDGVGTDGKPKYTNAEYKLTNGKIAYRYTFQIFKGKSFDDYANAFKAGGVLQIVSVFIEKKAANSSPANTPTNEWMWEDILTVLDGNKQYSDSDDSSRIGFSFQVGQNGIDLLGVNSTGNYTKPNSTKFELKYAGNVQGTLRLPVDKPGAKARSISSMKGQGAKKVIKM